MSYLDFKKRALMRIINSVKGFIRTITGVNSVTLDNCVDDDSLINLSIYGNSVQDGTPAPDNPIEIQSVGELSRNLLPDDNFQTFTSAYSTCEYEGNGVFHIYGEMDNSENDSVAKFNSLPYTDVNIPIELETQYTFHIMFVSGNIEGATFHPYIGLSSETSTHKNWMSRRIDGSSSEGQIVSYTGCPSNALSDANQINRFWIYTQILANSNAKFDFRVQIWLTKTDAAVDFEPYGKYKIPVKARGKNLFDVKKWYPDYLNDENGITCTNADMVAIYKIHPLKGEFKENTQYTFSVSYDTISADDSKSVFAIKMVDGEGKSLGMKTVVGTSSGTVSVVNSANTSVDYAYITYYSNTTAMSVKLSNIQIEEGSEATDYEPYHEPHTFNIWADEPIRKVGEYADILDVKKKLITRNVYYSPSISEVISSNNGSTYTTGLSRCQSGVVPTPNYSIAPLSNCLRGFSDNSLHGSSGCLSFVEKYRNAYIYFNNVILGFETPTENIISPDIAVKIKEFMDSKEMDIAYVLAEPIEETIEIPEIPTFKGTTIYEVETTIPSSAVEAEYYSSVSDE